MTKFPADYFIEALREVHRPTPRQVRFIMAGHAAYLARRVEVRAALGEEFGLVLTGQLAVRYGKKTWRLKKDDCFYFESLKAHQFANAGKNKVTFVWVMTPPQM